MTRMLEDILIFNKALSKVIQNPSTKLEIVEYCEYPITEGIQSSDRPSGGQPMCHRYQTKTAKVYFISHQPKSQSNPDW